MRIEFKEETTLLLIETDDENAMDIRRCPAGERMEISSYERKGDTISFICFDGTYKTEDVPIECFRVLTGQLPSEMGIV
jgi:hypothetical protein